MSRTIKYWLTLAVVFMSNACTTLEPSVRNNEMAPGFANVESVYEKTLQLAFTGDSESQNLLGVMLVNGEHSDIDLIEAHYWFHQAAQAGHQLAQRNDSLMHVQLDPSPKATKTQRTETIADITLELIAASTTTQSNALNDVVDSPQLKRGEKNYDLFCAGCHGFNGITAYVGSPSFALNEHLDKSDMELFRNISNGIGACPGWQNIVPDQDLMDMITYVRTLKPSFEMGIAQAPKPVPSYFFRFGAMSQDFTDL